MAAQIKASGSSETLTTTETETSGRQGLVLKLKVKPKPSAQSAVEQQGGQQGVTWDEGVVDNEFMNKKSSKQCCIFHKPRQFGESDSDESDRYFFNICPP
mmetsp:Transcript_27619/g.61681  ORF Transcript_27619/g.61681 Transcript_27619/m.61681 type:complete len:100 (+) Transcript_27619:368-667(+)